MSQPQRALVSDAAKLGGTIRSLSDEVYENTVTRMDIMSRAFSDLYGCEIEFDHTKGYPTLLNEEAPTKFSAKVAESIVGKNAVRQDFKPIMDAEDFAFMLQKSLAPSSQLDKAMGLSCIILSLISTTI